MTKIDLSFVLTSYGKKTIFDELFLVLRKIWCLMKSFNWLFNNNNNITLTFFLFFSCQMNIFVFRSGHTNVHSSVAEKKKKDDPCAPFFVIIEYIFLLLIRKDSLHFTLSHFFLRKKDFFFFT
jgi:hypothetical protein